MDNTVHSIINESTIQMFADPQTVTINAVAQVLPRIGTGPSGGTFQKEDQLYKLEVLHSKSKRTRHVVKLTMRKIAADPLTTANNLEYQASITLSVDGPNVGYTNLELTNAASGLATWLTAGSNANLIKLMGFEV